MKIRQEYENEVIEATIPYDGKGQIRIEYTKDDAETQIAIVPFEMLEAVVVTCWQKQIEKARLKVPFGNFMPPQGMFY